ncbi:nucleoprotein/polynucleotide-associated enzyme [Crenothrix sp. D3]|nr:nucleoprotein/polynucleotide-associated enzyme [Crenothrix sp. D3]
MSKQKLSLQEQLLKSGLVSSAQAKSAKSNKHKQEQLQRKNNIVQVDEAKAWSEKSRLEKLEKDLALNQLHQQQELKKQLLAQIKQLIEQNKLPRDEEGIAYRFINNNKVKTLYVSEIMRTQLINGQLAIVKLGKSYEVVTAEVAKKISERNADSVLVHNEPAANLAQVDDPYSDYAVPDDLMW